MNSTPEQVRLDQLQHARRTLSLSGEATQRPARETTREYPRTSRPGLAAASTRIPRPGSNRGHDMILKAMQENAQRATIITADGAKFEGVITGRDKYTITLKTTHPDEVRAAAGDKILRVFYKSAIEQFWGEQVPRIPARDISDTTRDEGGIAELKALSDMEQ